MYLFNIHVVILHLIKTDVLIFHKSRSHLNSFGVCRFTSSKFHTENPLILGVGVKNVFGRASWRPVFVHQCHLKRCSWYWVCYFAALLGFSPQWNCESVLLLFSYFLLVDVNVTQLHAYEGTDGSWRYISYHSQPGTRRRVVRTRPRRLHPTWKTRYLLYMGWVVPIVDLDGTESLAPSGIRLPDSFIPRKTLRIRHSHFKLCHFTSQSLITPCFDTV